MPTKATYIVHSEQLQVAGKASAQENNHSHHQLLDETANTGAARTDFHSIPLLLKSINDVIVDLPFEKENSRSSNQSSIDHYLPKGNVSLGLPNLRSIDGPHQVRKGNCGRSSMRSPMNRPQMRKGRDQPITRSTSHDSFEAGTQNHRGSTLSSGILSKISNHRRSATSTFNNHPDPALSTTDSAITHNITSPPDKTTLILITIVLLFVLTHSYRLSLRVYETMMPDTVTDDNFKTCLLLGRYVFI